jgi:hypothetical protein
VVPIVPPPWDLEGVACLLLYRFPPAIFRGKLRPEDTEDSRRFRGVGFLALVSYRRSPVGPYGEMLIVPGWLLYRGKRHYSVSRIYVTTAASAENGRRNWGLPKKLAEIRFERSGPRSQRVNARVNEEPALDLRLKARGPAVPLGSRFLPARLVQYMNGRIFSTAISGSGRLRWAGIESFEVSTELFPELSRIRPLLALQIERFRARFPAARLASG